MNMQQLLLGDYVLGPFVNEPWALKCGNGGGVEVVQEERGSLEMGLRRQAWERDEARRRQRIHLIAKRLTASKPTATKLPQIPKLRCIKVFLH